MENIAKKCILSFRSQMQQKSNIQLVSIKVYIPKYDAEMIAKYIEENYPQYKSHPKGVHHLAIGYREKIAPKKSLEPGKMVRDIAEEIVEIFLSKTQVDKDIKVERMKISLPLECDVNEVITCIHEEYSKEYEIHVKESNELSIGCVSKNPIANWSLVRYF